ncbi:hypothetical protein K8P10_002490 [Leucobacter sp. Psy1]|uniref:type II secretion system F family protein n=1 Tax=Leucobacter sp. Psy1 TaxID=2875729 RepID=UPI001CD78446|nr:type II secretion system F family protein [Leucobacter sp. Psy1]UBH06979.1 hypothetical protein K8P10_002490 [Leucobacter sp. Psy1]
MSTVGISALVRRLRGNGRTERFSAAAAAARTAVLLRGGVPSARVFGALAAEEPALHGIQARIVGGSPVPHALAAEESADWRLLGAVWAVADRTGAPLARTLEQISDALEGLEALRERREVLLTGPRMTVRLVAALPALAVLFGALLGFDPLRVFFSPTGAVLAAVGIALLVIGVRWARALSRSVGSRDRAEGLELLLVETALAGGGSPEAAIRSVAESAVETRATWIDLAHLCRSGSVRTVLASASSTGAPAGPMLVAEARAARVRAHAALEREAERLGIRVLVPLGVCVLPAFIALGVMPVLISMLGGLDIG